MYQRRREMCTSVITYISITYIVDTGRKGEIWVRTCFNRCLKGRLRSNPCSTGGWQAKAVCGWVNRNLLWARFQHRQSIVIVIISSTRWSKSLQILIRRIDDRCRVWAVMLVVLIRCCSENLFLKHFRYPPRRTPTGEAFLGNGDAERSNRESEERKWLKSTKTPEVRHWSREDWHVTTKRQPALSFGFDKVAKFEHPQPRSV